MPVSSVRRVFRRACRPPHRTNDDETSTASPAPPTSPAETFEQQDAPDDDLERYTCPICRELFVEPLYLHDQHAFCAKCLNEWVAWNSRDDGTLVSCPLCRKYTSVSAAHPAFDLVPPGHQVTWGTAGEVQTRVSAPCRPDLPRLVSAEPARPARIDTFARLARGWRRLVTALTPSCISSPPPQPRSAPITRSIPHDTRSLAVMTTTGTNVVIRRRKRAVARSLTLNDGRLIMYGAIHMKNEVNENGRKYAAPVLDREVAAYATHVNERRALGESGHPSPTRPTFRSLSMDNVSHQVLDCHWQGNLLMAHVEVLDTAKGREVRDFVVSGNVVGLAARGWATLREESDGIITVQSDYELITFDVIRWKPFPNLDKSQWTLSPLTRAYRNLSPPIDIEQACDSYKTEQLASGRGHTSRPRTAGQTVAHAAAA